METQKLEQLQPIELPKTTGSCCSTHHSTPRTTADIQAWLVDYIANLLAVAPDIIDPTASFDRYGLDSFTAISLTGELEIWLEREVDPMLLYDYPSVQTLAQFLAESRDN